MFGKHEIERPAAIRQRRKGKEMKRKEKRRKERKRDKTEKLHCIDCGCVRVQFVSVSVAVLKNS